MRKWIDRSGSSRRSPSPRSGAPAGDDDSGAAAGEAAPATREPPTARPGTAAATRPCRSPSPRRAAARCRPWGRASCRRRRSRSPCRANEFDSDDPERAGRSPPAPAASSSARAPRRARSSGSSAARSSSASRRRPTRASWRSSPASGGSRRRRRPATDVSQELVDLQARIRHLEAVEAQLLGFLERGGVRVLGALTVQQELNRVQLELEQARGRLVYLEDQVAFATISLEVRERQVAVAGRATAGRGASSTPGARPGPGFVTVVGWMFVAAATIAPVVLLLALAFLAARLAGWRGAPSLRRPQAYRAPPGIVPATNRPGGPHGQEEEGEGDRRGDAGPPLEGRRGRPHAARGGAGQERARHRRGRQGDERQGQARRGRQARGGPGRPGRRGASSRTCASTSSGSRSAWPSSSPTRSPRAEAERRRSRKTTTRAKKTTEKSSSPAPGRSIGGGTGRGSRLRRDCRLALAGHRSRSAPGRSRRSRASSRAARRRARRGAAIAALTTTRRRRSDLGLGVGQVRAAVDLGEGARRSRAFVTSPITRTSKRPSSGSASGRHVHAARRASRRWRRSPRHEARARARRRRRPRTRTFCQRAKTDGRRPEERRLAAERLRATCSPARRRRR